MKTVHVRVKLGKGAQMPEYQTAGAAGMDISANECVVIPARSFQGVKTGVFLEIPRGFEVQVRPRSGLALKHGIGILNGPGTIDSDYRGEVIVILFNLGRKAFAVAPGDRIAQLVCAQSVKVALHRVKALTPTRRGAAGFGHTGRQARDS
jgi:dUTP pyrophosphatase